jgi:hypothetical protein
MFLPVLNLAEPFKYYLMVLRINSNSGIPYKKSNLHLIIHKTAKADLPSGICKLKGIVDKFISICLASPHQLIFRRVLPAGN